MTLRTIRKSRKNRHEKQRVRSIAPPSPLHKKTIGKFCCMRSNESNICPIYKISNYKAIFPFKRNNEIDNFFLTMVNE